ncbi:MAG TPA: condensation domain-containing protein, partial [Thermoanaerobaculia bacterium]|nr:condensation domain-containing protein [Thermoanaerobaculia bacterium]
RGRLDRAALAACIHEVVRRHEALRATFPVVDGQPVQRIAPDATVALPLIDLTGLPEHRREPEATALAAGSFRRRLDLERGPLVELLLLWTGADEHVLVSTFHHILFDGWSGGVLTREVAALYASFMEGRPSPLPELPIQYPDFAVWQRENLTGETLEGLLAYWRGRLSGELPVLELPGSRPGAAAVTTMSSAVQWVDLGPAVGRAVRALTRAEGATLFVTLLAGFQALLHRSTRQSDILVGTPIANRNRPEIEDLIGYFVNTLVMRGDLTGDPTFRELVGRARETALEAYAHQDLPFTKLVEELRPDRAASRTPLFQVLFLLQNAPQPPLELPGLTMSPFEAELPLATYDLSLVLAEEAGDGLAGSVRYNRDLLDFRAVSDLTGRYRILLENAMSDPDRRLSELSLLTDPERQQLLAGRPVPSTMAPAATAETGELIHGRFEQRADDDPDAVALRFEGEETTYGELDERANRLARRLLELGVGPEVRVGLCLERKPELVVAILAVLKAGGAYVPLDPAYPQERLAFLLEDSGVRALVAERSAAGHLPESAVPAVWLDEEDLDRYPADRLELAGTPSNAAYVIYTSGSTGKPKGVVVTHANVLRLFDETADWFRFDERD